MNFKSLGINNYLVEILSKNGIKEPTSIQSECIMPILNGSDVIGEAKTGTGKTLAFLLPVIQNINTKNNTTQALILAPTRELAIQITEEAKKLNSNNEINILDLYGGRDIARQLKKLSGGVHLIIATPGRLLDHIERKTVDLSKIKTVILDEADQMLLMGFRNEIDKIMKVTSKKHQTLCFSATMGPDVKKLAYRYMNDPVVVNIKSATVTIDAIRQEIVRSSDRWKQDSLAEVLKEDNPFMAIIFCRTKRRADELEIGLAKKGFKCEKIHSDVPQPKRERIIKAFRNADIQYLIATDVASRGIDISGVTHIYNYDCPETPEIYIHRIGRTGRAKEDGYTCMFIAPKDEKMLEDIESKIKSHIPERYIELNK